MEHFIEANIKKKFSHHHIQLAWNNLISDLENNPSPQRLQKIKDLTAMNTLPKPLLESWERIATQLVVQLMIGQRLTDVEVSEFLHNTLSKGVATLQAVKVEDPSIDLIEAQKCLETIISNFS